MQHLLFHTVTPGIGIYQQLLTRIGGSGPAPAVVRPPGRLADLEVGGPCLHVSRECSVSGDHIDFDVMRASGRPACFHLGGLLSPAECEQLAQAADAQGSAKATTFGGAVTSAWRRGCDVAWLRVDGGTPAAIAACCEQLLLTTQARAGHMTPSRLEYEPAPTPPSYAPAPTQVPRCCACHCARRGVLATPNPNPSPSPDPNQARGAGRFENLQARACACA